MNFVPNTWMDCRTLAVSGAASALPGEPVTTRELAERIAERFGVDLTRRALKMERRLNIHRRHLARDFAACQEGTRAGRRQCGPGRPGGTGSTQSGRVASK